MFINSKSGGRAGAKLTEVLYHTLGHAQASGTASFNVEIMLSAVRVCYVHEEWLTACTPRCCWIVKDSTCVSGLHAHSFGIACACI